MSIQTEALTGVYENMTRGIVALVFRCRPLNQPLATTAEARKIRWLDPSEIPALMDEAYAVRILDALEPGPARVRAHDGVKSCQTASTRPQPGRSRHPPCRKRTKH